MTTPKWTNTCRVTRYLHANNDGYSDLWDLDAPQQSVYGYALYEISVTLEVDLDTGHARIVAIDGVGLEKPVPA